MKVEEDDEEVDEEEDAMASLSDNVVYCDMEDLAGTVGWHCSC